MAPRSKWRGAFLLALVGTIGETRKKDANGVDRLTMPGKLLLAIALLVFVLSTVQLVKKLERETEATTEQLAASAVGNKELARSLRRLGDELEPFARFARIDNSGRAPDGNDFFPPELVRSQTEPLSQRVERVRSVMQTFNQRLDATTLTLAQNTLNHRLLVQVEFWRRNNAVSPKIMGYTERSVEDLRRRIQETVCRSLRNVALKYTVLEIEESKDQRVYTKPSDGTSSTDSASAFRQRTNSSHLVLRNGDLIRICSEAACNALAKGEDAATECEPVTPDEG